MATFTDRARAAFLGLALGDAYGRPLEFTTGAAVRARPAGPGHDFMWTDDTHMSLYLAEAALAHGAGALDADRFGACVGAQFSAWLDDPLTPSTAPGNTCMAGARAWRRTRDWRSSGVTRSDGCGAVMRICPLPILFSGDALIEAARVQAVVTHAHPNAPEASVAASWILRQLLEGRSLDGALITEAAYMFRSGQWAATHPTVTQALYAASEVGARADMDWLDEAAIPDGDGGWRSPSALGLALAAALRWGRDADGRVTPATFARAVEKAARIQGDSDSVACLAGMFLGAAGGRAALPPGWLSALPRRGTIDATAQRLAAAGAGGRVTPGDDVSDDVPDSAAPADGADSADSAVWVAVADLHGHPVQLDALVRALDAALGDRWNLVTLGDYVDNGPDIPGLLDRLIALRAARPDRFVPILGNHDLACLRALGWPGVDPDPIWFDRWIARYGARSTAAAYGARSAASLAARMPAAHQAFLRSLPWFYDAGEHLFVHAGMEAGPLGPQRVRLAHKLLPEVHTWLPPQIRDKDLAGVSDPSWDRVVVSAHTKDPARRAGIRGAAPHVLTDTRICLSGEVDVSGVLYAVELPSRRIWRVGPGGQVSRQ